MTYNYAIIKERRIEKGLTQLDVAEKLGYKDRTSIAHIESGAKQLPGVKLIQLAELLDLELKDLQRQ